MSKSTCDHVKFKWNVYHREHPVCGKCCLTFFILGALVVQILNILL